MAIKEHIQTKRALTAIGHFFEESNCFDSVYKLLQGLRTSS